jgi:signal peptidase I
MNDEQSSSLGDPSRDSSGFQAGPSTRMRYLAGGILGLLLIVAVAIAAVTLMADQVDGHSMNPTLKNGERFLVHPGTRGRTERFDVVVMHGGRTATPLVKRVIALPGDRLVIETDPANGYRVLIQPQGQGSWFQVVAPSWTGQSAQSVQCCDPSGIRTTKPEVEVVPAGKMFVLGDNPDASTDSRSFGWADIARIEGRVSIRIWPLSAPRGIGNRPTLKEVPAPKL